MKNQVSLTGLFRSLLLLSAVVLFSQCDTEEPEAENEEELITTMSLTFVPTTGGGDPVFFSVFDADGDGPIEPVYTDGQESILDAGVSYNVAIQVLNTTENPAENITEEILEEGDDHQFFFETSNGLNLDFAYDDVDEDGNPVGVTSIFTTGEASEGTLTVTLRHEPNKSAEGVKTGDITKAGGETDVQAIFSVVIK
ncbi:hypothetical protein GCM10011506_25350 [Marivirga lumbricoides]|uniref:Type 1 periplasmic binding fold superfamily protein n=1 Tax=Marivirga lumbricoides TaxID=1046115 RepID=A0ABQ1MDD2_9BACT|nr:hypothetical protein GCM10011506_25350 [Marivirga lumbricoides]